MLYSFWGSFWGSSLYSLLMASVGKNRLDVTGLQFTVKKGMGLGLGLAALVTLRGGLTGARSCLHSLCGGSSTCWCLGVNWTLGWPKALLLLQCKSAAGACTVRQGVSSPVCTGLPLLLLWTESRFFLVMSVCTRVCVCACGHLWVWVAGFPSIFSRDI
jgi:hypothetical protein